MAAMPARSLGRVLLISAAVLCIPAAIAVIVFAQGWALLDAFDAARPCATPTRDARADCLSLIEGKVIAEGSAGRNTHQAAIDLGDTTVVAQYPGPNSLRQGDAVVTEWWRGKLVALGLQGTSPAIITNDSPTRRLETSSFFLFLVILAVSVLVAGLLVLQAPTTQQELIAASLARWPDPPRPVNRAAAWRTAWGGSFACLPFFAWFVLYTFFGFLIVLATTQPRLAPLLLVATFVIAYALPLAGAAAVFEELVRDSTKRTVTVQRIQTGLGRSGKDANIWYALNDGHEAKFMLGPAWNGGVNVGARLDALTEPSSGKILRLLSTPPAPPMPVGQE